MSNAVMKTNGAATNAVIEYSAEQVDLIKSLIAPKANDTELKLFLYHCQRTGLDALSRQIYAIHRWNAQQQKEVMTIQTSIDGFRVVAERSGNYAGQGEPEFFDKDGKLDCCKVRVFKFGPNDQRYEAAVGVAYWNEYVQTTKDGRPSGLWAKMPHVMLSKVAEAVALRKAFPQDLSGLYTSEEMNQAEEEVQEAEVVQEVKKDNKKDTKQIESKASVKQEEDAMLQWKQAINGCKTLDELKQLYDGNQAVIDAYPAIKALFTERKKQLKPQTATAK